MLLTYKSLHGLGPKYLTDMIPLHNPSRPLRSSETNLLIIPRVNTKHGKAGFSYYATNSWNKLPEDLRLALTLTTFKTRLKTFMVAIAIDLSHVAAFAKECSSVGAQKQVSQKDRLVAGFIVEDMLSLSTIESPRFRKILDKLPATRKPTSD